MKPWVASSKGGRSVWEKDLPLGSRIEETFKDFAVEDVSYCATIGCGKAALGLGCANFRVAPIDEHVGCG